jgi:hypothetical protein
LNYKGNDLTEELGSAGSVEYELRWRIFILQGEAAKAKLLKDK